MGPSENGDLAAYREVEALAQLGMELGAAPQRQLDRGGHMVELLKPGQYKPHGVIDLASIAQVLASC